MYLSFTGLVLLSLVRSHLAYIGHDLGSVLGDGVKVSPTNGSLVKERGNQTNRGSAVAQKLTRIVQVNTRSRVDGQERHGRAHCLDPARTASDAREELLQGSAMSVSIDELSRRLAARHTHNVALLAPLNHIRQHDWRDDKLTARVHGRRRVVRGQNRPAANHHLAVILLTKVSQMIQTVGRRQSKLTDLESSVNGSLHGLGAVVRGRRAEDGTRTNLSKCVQDALVHVDRLDAVQTARGGGGGEEAGGGGLAGSESESHGRRVCSIKGRLTGEAERRDRIMRKVKGRPLVGSELKAA
jgi:hypothetical protein